MLQQPLTSTIHFTTLGATTRLPKLAPDRGSRACPLCATENGHRSPLRYGPADWPLKQCDACELVYLERVLPYDQLAREHAWCDRFADAKQDRRAAEPVRSAVTRRARRWQKQLWPPRKALRWIEEFVSSGNILDVGCSWGKTLRRLNEQFVPYGIEIGAEMAHTADEYARSRGGRVLHADALAGLRAFEDDWFDGVLMQSYLEHETQPLPALKQTARVVKPGGHLIVKVPNYGTWNRAIRGDRWCGFRFPDHVNYFTPQTLRAVLQRAGFEIARFGARDRMPTSDSMWLVARKPTACSSFAVTA